MSATRPVSVAPARKTSARQYQATRLGAIRRPPFSVKGRSRERTSRNSFTSGQRSRPIRSRRTFDGSSIHRRIRPSANAIASSSSSRRVRATRSRALGWVSPLPTSDSSGVSSSCCSGLMERNVFRYRVAPNLATVSSRTSGTGESRQPLSSPILSASCARIRPWMASRISSPPSASNPPDTADWMRFIFALCRTSGRSSPPSATTWVFLGDSARPVAFSSST